MSFSPFIEDTKNGIFNERTCKFFFQTVLLLIWWVISAILIIIPHYMDRDDAESLQLSPCKSVKEFTEFLLKKRSTKLSERKIFSSSIQIKYLHFKNPVSLP